MRRALTTITASGILAPVRESWYGGAVEHAVEHFKTYGWSRVSGAFAPRAAAQMRKAVWRALTAAGIKADDPSTWLMERPTSLQALKEDPVFDAVGGERLCAVLDAILGTGTYATPGNWGALFAAFPTSAAWHIPTRGWHLDAHYASALWPTRGVKTHALLDEVSPRGGGTLMISGSHRLVHNWFKAHPLPPGRA